MALRPGGTLPQKLPGRAQLWGGYRMLNHPGVTHAAILDAHRRSCTEEIARAGSGGGGGTLLLIHDTTVLDYSGLGVEGLGQVGNGRGRGLYAHHSLAVWREGRRVVGLLGQILHRRAKVPKGERRARRAARAGRESRLWRKAVEGQPALPAGVEVIDVSDRGSDLTEYIAFEVEHRRRFILRSQHDRRLAGGDGSPLARKLHERMRGLSPMDRYGLHIPGAGGGREVSIALAWKPVRILPPRQKRGEHGAEPLPLTALIAREERPGDPAGPIEWVLLTNLEVRDAASARRVVSDYACRWLVEDYHKALKTGCGIERTQLTTRHALANFIALTSVLAVRVLRLRCAARDPATAERPARLHEEALKVRLAARHARHGDWRAMSVHEFYLAVARLGGYTLNPAKRPPGWIVLWRGYTRLEEMAAGVRLLAEDV
jgi:hypothetical protein